MANIEDTHYTETDTNSNNQVQNDINTEDSEPSDTWMQSILQAPETDSEDEQVMGLNPTKHGRNSSRALNVLQVSTYVRRAFATHCRGQSLPPLAPTSWQ